MALFLGDTAPDFTQDSTMGPLHLYKYLNGSWGLFFSHPRDFTPVCTTELGKAANYNNRFKERGVKLRALSVDSVDDHRKWIKDIEEVTDEKIDFPIIADHDKRVSTLFGMIHPQNNDTETVRALFLIDPAKQIRHITIYPNSTGRDFDEILRVTDSLILSDRYNVRTPANWKKGDDVIIDPEIPESHIKQAVNCKVKRLKPYLKYIDYPSALSKVKVD